MDFHRRLLLIAIACAPLPARGQPAGRRRTPKIGYLVLQSIGNTPSPERLAFLDELRKLGYVPGKNIEMVYASAEGDEDFLKDACEDLIRKKVDLIVTAGALPSVTARAETKTIPIVMLAVGDPAGMVKTLSRPGGNLTGVSYLSTDLAGKRMQLLKDLVPGAKRIAVLWNSKNSNARDERNAAVAAAKSLGLETNDITVTTGPELDDALDQLPRRKADGLYVAFEGGLIASRRSDIVQYGLDNRVPVVSGWTFMTEGGALFSYAPDLGLIFRRAAHYVQKILQGTPPGNLPIEMPTKIELVINLKTAKALGIHVSEAFRLRADRMIE